MNKKVREREPGSETSTKEPLIDFVGMECDLAGDLCSSVDAALSSLKKVRIMHNESFLHDNTYNSNFSLLFCSPLIIKTSSRYLQVLFGSGLLTPVIQAAATALLSSAVPSDWTGRWEGGPEKPQSWLRELVRKRISLMKWRTAAAKGAAGLLSDPLVLGDLFNPATFINALRQQTARKLGTAIDRVKMTCSWEKDPRTLRIVCPLTCTLSGLLLQGASFHGGCLQGSSPEASEMTPTPHVTLGFVPIDSGEKDSKERETIGIPVYLSPSREDFLMEVDVPVDGKGDTGKWVLSGVALFLTEDD